MDSSNHSPKSLLKGWRDTALLYIGIFIVLISYDGIPRLWYKVAEINGVGYANLVKLINDGIYNDEIEVAIADNKVSISEYNSILQLYKVEHGEFKQVPEVPGVTDRQAYNLMEWRDQLIHLFLKVDGGSP